MATPDIKWAQEGELSTHRGFVRNERSMLGVSRLTLGDVIAFVYSAKPRFVMVVHPNWEGKLHGLDLKNISRDVLLQSIVPRLDTVVDPKIFYDTVYKKDVLYSLDAYRTYNLDKIQTIMKYDYDVPNVSDDFTKRRYNDNDL